MMGKTLHLNFKDVKPSLLKGPFRYSSVKKSPASSDDDVPDLASTSCASDHESSNNKKKRQVVPQEAILNSDVSESHDNNENDELDDFLPPRLPLQQQEQETTTEPTIQHTSSTSDLLSAVLNQEEVGIAADREQRLVVKNCIPANIVLLPDYSSNEEDSESSSCSTSSLEDRLENAEALVHSYQDTIRSNEHLIESLHKTITKTREEAFDIMSSHKDLEQAVAILLEEREKEEDEDMVTEPKIFLKMAMATSLLLYFFGITTEYPLIATVVVYLLEGVL